VKRYERKIIIGTFFAFTVPGIVLAAQSSEPKGFFCAASQLSFSTDDENGYFTGMSHSGTLLVLRNVGSSACTVPRRPEIAFEDARHHRLPISLDAPRGMHPGPVILPVVIPEGAEVTSQLRWVSSDAFGANNGIYPAFITLSIGEQTLRLKFSGQLFGPAGSQPTYSATPFSRDPTYTPSKP
jgi:hypothetical protein